MSPQRMGYRRAPTEEVAMDESERNRMGGMTWAVLVFIAVLLVFLVIGIAVY